MKSSNEQASTDPLRILSAREQQILAMASRGLSNRQIAVELQVTVHAVKFHLASIFRKLSVGNRTEAAVVFAKAMQFEGVRTGFVG
jgi:DNA-binding NarL/FixJ family response regulator